MTSFHFDPRTPSHSDMKTQQLLDVEFGIVHCDGENVTDILWFGDNNKLPELIGRKYVNNVTDCYTIARDYYWMKYNLDLGSHPRPADWYEWDSSYIKPHFLSYGFEPLINSDETPIAGDILLFCISTHHINHIGVVIEDDKFLHHLNDRISGYDSIKKWYRQLSMVLRLPTK